MAVDGDRRRAIALYEWNTRVSAAFYVPLQTVEVGLRNACQGGSEPQGRPIDTSARHVQTMSPCFAGSMEHEPV